MNTKFKILLIGVILILFIIGCSKDASPVPSIEPEMTEASVTEAAEDVITETEVTTTKVADFGKYYDLLKSDGTERNWMFFATGCLFSKPEEIDLSTMFYLGTGHGGWEVISEESRKHLLDSDFMAEMDLQVMPTDVLDTILRSTFGISLVEVKIPDEWEYIAAEDAYCSNHNDALIPSPITIISVTEYSNGQIVINYTVDCLYDMVTDTFYWNPALMLRLHKSEDGNIWIDSNTIG